MIVALRREQFPGGNSASLHKEGNRSWSGENSGAVPKRYLLDVRGGAGRCKRRPHLVPALTLRRIKKRLRDRNQLRSREFTDRSRRDAELAVTNPNRPGPSFGMGAFSTGLRILSAIRIASTNGSPGKTTRNYSPP
jgi:hypothetical protein